MIFKITFTFFKSNLKGIIMRYILLMLLCVSTVFAQDYDVLDPPSMQQGEKGKFPKTTKDREYFILRVIDDHILMAIQGPTIFRGKSVLGYTVRFWIRDEEMVKKYEKLEMGVLLSIQIEMPDVYQVVGRKTIGQDTLKVIKIIQKAKPQEPVKEKK